MKSNFLITFLTVFLLSSSHAQAQDSKSVFDRFNNAITELEAEAAKAQTNPIAQVELAYEYALVEVSDGTTEFMTGFIKISKNADEEYDIDISVFSTHPNAPPNYSTTLCTAGKLENNVITIPIEFPNDPKTHIVQIYLTSTPELIEKANDLPEFMREKVKNLPTGTVAVVTDLETPEMYPMNDVYMRAMNGGPTISGLYKVK